MPAVMLYRILSSCLPFKNEVHRTTTLRGGVRLAYVKCVKGFGSGDGKEELVACTVYRKLCG